MIAHVNLHIVDQDGETIYKGTITVRGESKAELLKNVELVKAELLEVGECTKWEEERR